MADSPPPTYFTDWPARVVHVGGADRGKFLHNLCTADVLKMQPGDVREAFFTSVKGHVLAHAVLAAGEESITVLVFARDAAPLVAHLDRYLIREDVTLATEVAHPVLAVGLAAAGDDVAFPVVDGTACVILGGGDYEGRGMARGDDEALAAVRVASGWPLAGVDFGEAALPQELSRTTQAVSFTKGCYLGQETVARLDALGRVNKQLVRVVAAEPIAAGSELVDGDKVVGTVTTVAHVAGGFAGLAMVRRGSNADGTKLASPMGELTVEWLGD